MKPLLGWAKRGLAHDVRRLVAPNVIEIAQVRRPQSLLHSWGIQHRQWIELSPPDGLWLAPPEYVILRKLEFYREGHSAKHLDDIRGMLDVSADAIDRTLIADWAQKLSLEPQWAEASK